jgi:hypothetical protein
LGEINPPDENQQNKTMSAKHDTKEEKITKADVKSDTITPAKKAKVIGHTVQKKITMKPLQALPMDATMRIAGIVARTEQVTTAYGESTRFIGDIAAKVMPGGEIIRAGSAFLPRQAEGIIAGAMASHMSDEHFKGVEFALVIGKVEAKTKTGYEWTVKTLVDTEPTEDKTLALLGE